MSKEIVAARYRNTAASALEEGADLAKRYADVADFTLGDPDLATPEIIIRAAAEDALAGHTHYTDSCGDPELIEEILAFQREEYGMALSKENVLVTTSACHGMWLVLEAMLDPGDEVIVIEPYFPPYADQIAMAGGVPVFVETDPDAGFVPDIEQIRRKITEKTKAIILNTPNNPSGLTLNTETLTEIGHLAKEADLFLIADDIYTAFSYETPFVPVASLEDFFSRTVTLRSFSKNFAMTGWRIGYILADPALIRAADIINESNVYAAPSISQRAAIHALRHRKAVQPALVAEFKKRTRRAYERIRRLKNVHVAPPRGTFYLFMDVRPTGLSEEEVWRRLAEEAHVLTVRGSGFGKSAEGFLRLAVTLDVDAIDRAFDRIEQMEIFQ
ncbi:Aspartate aminotransferase [Aedoeadaptatus ivorii]|uniref:Aminotransferase n=1 Tax=Aedoeadaptatus ivorii TaxID=54006 RepID=A0A448UZK1_9FIRM|nr:aminotransferase class I/II-fold pyridoxal phosphate-dependent enzyme [Peptoniphilus ivorii]MDQ0508552.1 aspartate/methionine/tyrosine aminotransferase [Peptoniphilus ivorii]VEJ34398.1 Aspartate aminotransferase [Peptoniphilus ivorii]